jgi:hypothetical protein
MSIYLEQRERDLLKELIGVPQEFEWWKKKLLEKIADDEECLKEIQECKHKYGEYIGKRLSCKKCDHRISESWFFKKNISNYMANKARASLAKRNTTAIQKKGERKSDRCKPIRLL